MITLSLVVTVLVIFCAGIAAGAMTGGAIRAGRWCGRTLYRRHHGGNHRERNPS